VLRTYKLRESDRIVVFHTLENGKVRAVAKGVARPSHGSAPASNR
jgi:DNA repair protein RecO (recombination protein O)